MPKIIVMNVGIEEMTGRGLTDAQPVLTAKSSLRNAWFADEGDVIVTQFQLPDRFLTYIGRILGFDARSVSVIKPHSDNAAGVALIDELLLTQNVIEELRARVLRPAEWSILPCFHTQGIRELASELGLPDSTGLSFASQNGPDLLNRKTHFRQLAAGSGLPIAHGAVVYSSGQLAVAISKLLPETGAVIVKRDNGAGGMGNIVLTERDAHPLPGAREVRKISSDVHTDAATLWSAVTDPWNTAVVVETYHDASCFFYIEFFIEANGAPRFLNSGTIRLRAHVCDAPALLWTGLDIPADLPPFFLSDALVLATRFISRVADLGYRGHINIDAIITHDRGILFNEINARWGGGSVMHAVAERLLGKHYANDRALASLRDVPSQSFTDSLQMLNELQIGFDSCSGEGVIVLASDEDQTGTMECLITGRSWTAVRKMESLLLA